MQRVVVTVKRKDEARVRDLEVPADIDAIRLAKLIATALGWGSDRVGQPLTYQIEAHPLGRMLQPEESLATAGVWDGSWLVLHPDVVEAPLTKVMAVEVPPPPAPAPVAPKPPAPIETPAPRAIRTPPPVEVSKEPIPERSQETPAAEAPPREEIAAIAEPPAVTKPLQAATLGETLSPAKDQTPSENLIATNALPAEPLPAEETLSPVDAVDMRSTSTPQTVENAPARTEETLPTIEAAPAAHVHPSLMPKSSRADEGTPADAAVQKKPLVDETYMDTSGKQPEVSATQFASGGKLPGSEVTQIAAPSWVDEAEPVDETPSIEESQDISQTPTGGEVEADDDSWLKLFLGTNTGTEPQTEAAQAQSDVVTPLPDLFASNEQREVGQLPADENIPSTFEPAPAAQEPPLASSATTWDNATQPAAQAKPPVAPVPIPAPGPPKPSELASPSTGPVAGWRKVVDLASGLEPSQAEEKPQSRFVWKQLDDE